jgi:ATP-binding cassette subfamily B protein/subfamily B ATP-binding cassette protein MsbA
MLTPLTKGLADAWTTHDNVKAFQIPLLIGGVWILSSIFRYFYKFWMLYIAELISVNLRRQLMNKYLSLNLGFFQNFEKGSGGLMSRMLNDINVIQGGFQKVTDMISEPVRATISFMYLLKLDWKLTLFIIAGLPLTTFVSRKFAKSVRKYARRNQESMEDLTQILKESLDGTRVVQSFNLQDEMRRRFENQASDFLHSKKLMISRDEASGPISESLASVFIVALLFYIGYRTVHTDFQLSDFVGFMTAVTLISDAARKIQGAYIKMQQGVIALERTQQILDSTSVVPEPSQPKPFPNDWNEIEFRNVSFSYDNHEVLKNVNLKIKRGEQIALVGTSGAGKSTLINLLPRFFDPTGGQVLIGGVPIIEMPLAELRSKVALVTQDVFLFSDTVERNIWSGDFAKPSDKVETSAQFANAHEFISKSEAGYQSRVGERGTRFSGGEKQRISIARAIFKDAPILILDEATSALDSKSELEVQEGLDTLMKGRTAFVIAHRLSTIAKCDRILVLEKGEVIEEGTHDQLLARQGAYQRFYQLQARL